MIGSFFYSFLLQLCPGRCLHAPFGQIAVCAECRCPANLLDKEVKTHQLVTPWTPLVASSRKNLIPAVCSGISLPSWHNTAIPCWQCTPCCRCRWSSSPLLGQRRPTQCRWSFHQLGSRHSATVPFLWLWPEHGTTFRQRSGPHRCSWRSANNLKHSFFKQLFTDLLTGLSELNRVKYPSNVLKC